MNKNIANRCKHGNLPIFLNSGDMLGAVPLLNLVQFPPGNGYKRKMLIRLPLLKVNHANLTFMVLRLHFRLCPPNFVIQ